jgi:hypothetical protein
MSASPRTVLPVSPREALAALEDRRFIALCAGDVVHGPPKGDGILRGTLTHVQGEAEIRYQLTVRVVEADADEWRLRYDVRAREARGDSLAALRLDADLGVVDEQTTIALQAHLVLAGSHGGNAYSDLQHAVTRAVEALGPRIASLMGEHDVRADLVHPSAVEDCVARRNERALLARVCALATSRTNQAVIAIATATGFSVAAYLWARRRLAQSTTSLHSRPL